MALTTNEHDDVISGINVTPLVDVMLVLLVVSMVTARVLASPTLPLDLPKAATATAEHGPFTVALDAAGIARVGARAVDDAALGRAAGEARARDAELRAVIEASPAAPHGAVVRVIDVLRAAGVTRIAFAVAPAERSR